MPYQAMKSFYWQNTWFDARVLRGGIFTMPV